jgi:outer membrane immunogenic protein
MRVIVVAVLALLAGLGCAVAADMPVPQAAPVPPPTYYPAYYNWSGVYLGVNGGYGFGQSQCSVDGVSTGNFNIKGFLVGGTLGVNYQTGSYLVGFESDFDWSGVQGSSSTAACVAAGAAGVPPLAAGTTCQTKSTWLGTARARVGYAFDRLLLFGTGGAAFSNLQPVLNPGGVISQPPAQLGWTAGAGVEYAFTDAISTKIEYLFVNLGTVTCPTATGCGPFGAHSFTFTENVVRAGVNYRFSW